MLSCSDDADLSMVTMMVMILMDDIDGKCWLYVLMAIIKMMM